MKTLSRSSLLAALCGICVAAPTRRSAPGSFTFYPLTTPEAGPCDMTTGPDGAIWIDTFLANKIGRVNETTGKVDEYDIPYTLPPLPYSALPADAQGRIALACVIQPGEDGMLYAAAGIRNQVVRIDPTSKKIDVFTPQPFNPAGNLEPFNDMWAGPTGMYFSQTSGNVISLFDYTTNQFTNYPVPTPNSGPLGMRIAADGALWFTEFFANKIGRLNITTGTITEYPVPASGFGPAVMRAETEDRYLWFTALVGNGIGRVDEQTGDVVVYTNPAPLSFPTEDDTDSKGNVWFSTLSSNTLNYFTPSTQQFTSIPQPDDLLAPLPVGVPPAFDVAMHYQKSDNSMWFTELANNRVGKYQLQN